MSKELTVSLLDLVPKAMTRERGREAAGKLRLRASKASAARIYLQAFAPPFATASFFDELVQQAARMKNEGGPEVVFIIRDEETLEKLQKSVTWRRLTCRYQRDGDRSVKTLKPETTRPPVSDPEVVSKSEFFATMSR